MTPKELLAKIQRNLVHDAVIDLEGPSYFVLTVPEHNGVSEPPPNLFVHVADDRYNQYEWFEEEGLDQEANVAMVIAQGETQHEPWPLSRYYACLEAAYRRVDILDMLTDAGWEPSNEGILSPGGRLYADWDAVLDHMIRKFEG